MTGQQERKTCAYPGCGRDDNLDLRGIENSETGKTKNGWLCPDHDPAEGPVVENRIVEAIDEDTALDVSELANVTGHEPDEIQDALETLMDGGLITSTPEFGYRLARRETNV